MRNITDKIKSITLIVTSVMTVDSWVKSRSSDKTNKILEDVIQQNENRLKELSEIKSNALVKSDITNTLYTKINSTYLRVLEHYEKLKANNVRLKNYKEESEVDQTIIEAIRRDSVEILERISTEIIEYEKNIDTDLSTVLKSIDEDQTKLVGAFNDVLNNFICYLDMLSTEQKGALAHLLFAITIIYLAWSIFILYYADRAIIYFKLENKYPRLTRWIKYRRILQHYSIGFNLLLIFIISAYFGYINLNILLE